MRVKFLDQAKDDLVEIAAHYRNIGGLPLARKMIQVIKKLVLNLKDDPEIAPPYDLAPDIHRLVVADGAFLVFYRVREDVEVLHIRRSEREPVTAKMLDKFA